MTSFKEKLDYVVDQIPKSTALVFAIGSIPVAVFTTTLAVATTIQNLQLTSLSKEQNDVIMELKNRVDKQQSAMDNATSVLHDATVAMETLQDEYTPCTVEQTAEINKARLWIASHIDDIGIAYHIEEKVQKLIGVDVGEDSDIQSNLDLIAKASTAGETQFFCATTNIKEGDYDEVVLGKALRNQTPDLSGQITIFPATFDIGEKCKLYETVVHEMAHVVLGKKHIPGRNPVFDDIYRIGTSAYMVCLD